MMKSAKKQWRH